MADLNPSEAANRLVASVEKHEHIIVQRDDFPVSVFLDFFRTPDGRNVSVEVRRSGLGVIIGPAWFGDGPEEIYYDVETAERRLLELIGVNG
jgi:hypothetical protein